MLVPRMRRTPGIRLLKQPRNLVTLLQPGEFKRACVWDAADLRRLKSSLAFATGTQEKTTYMSL